MLAARPGMGSDRIGLAQTRPLHHVSSMTYPVNETLLSCFPNLSGGERGGLCVTLLREQDRRATELCYYYRGPGLLVARFW